MIKNTAHFSREIMLSIYKALILPHINYCLFHGVLAVLPKYFFRAEKAIRTISCAGYNAQTEPLFKIHKLLKIEDIYNCRLLVPYYMLSHNKAPQYLSSFLPNTSLATNRYLIRHPRLQSLFHSHAFILQTSKYKLPVLHNSINNQSDDETVIVRNVNKTSLSGFKKKQQSFITLVNTRMGVLFRIATFVRYNYFISYCLFRVLHLLL